jgi:hypothetical protein
MYLNTLTADHLRAALQAQRTVTPENYPTESKPFSETVVRTILRDLERRELTATVGTDEVFEICEALRVPCWCYKITTAPKKNTRNT